MYIHRISFFKFQNSNLHNIDSKPLIVLTCAMISGDAFRMILWIRRTSCCRSKCCRCCSRTRPASTKGCVWYLANFMFVQASSVVGKFSGNEVVSVGNFCCAVEKTNLTSFSRPWMMWQPFLLLLWVDFPQLLLLNYFSVKMLTILQNLHCLVSLKYHN